MNFTHYASALGCSLLLSQLVVADEPTALDLDQIVVTGALTPLSVDQVGSAITVFTRDDIERREARHITDLLRSVPGFAVSHTGVVGSQTQVRVRGAEANHVLVLIDGVRANDPATGDEFRWEYLSTGNIERIEVVRGPQSSLWGSDAVAAVIHIITRSGESGTGGSAYAEGGSFATRNAGLKGSLGGQRWSLQVGIESLATDGSNVARQGSENDDADLLTANLSGDFAASDSLSLSFGLRAIDAYSQFDPVDYFVTGLPTDGDVATDTENLYAHAGGVVDADGGRVAHRFGIRYFDSSNRNLADGRENSSTASERTSYAYQADIRLGDNVLSLALEREETEFEQRGAVSYGDPNQRQTMDITSVVAEWQGHSVERLTWIFSVRADDNSEFDDALNGRLSLAYSLSDVTTLRANIGSGQKNPTFIERFGFFPQQFVGNPSLKPERSLSYEIGLDQKLLHGALLLQASLFRQDLRDEINGYVFDPVAMVVTAQNMTGKSKRSGVELGARWALTDTLGFGAHYTYTDATELDFLGNDVGELRRPRHSGGLSVDFRGLDERFAASLNADYGGTRSDIFFPPYPSPSEIVTLDNYWLLAATTQLKVSDAVTVFLRGSNLLDEDYEQVFGYRTQGRAAYLGMRLGFGL